VTILSRSTDVPHRELVAMELQRTVKEEGLGSVMKPPEAPEAGLLTDKISLLSPYA